jgi:hypothetical protein
MSPGHQRAMNAITNGGRRENIIYPRDADEKEESLAASNGLLLQLCHEILRKYLDIFRVAGA